MELIDIQNNTDLKTAFGQNDLLTFYAKYVSEEAFPNLVKLALINISLFGSTYSCEQAHTAVNKHIQL